MGVCISGAPGALLTSFVLCLPERGFLTIPPLVLLWAIPGCVVSVTIVTQVFPEPVGKSLPPQPTPLRGLLRLPLPYSSAFLGSPSSEGAPQPLPRQANPPTLELCSERGRRPCIFLGRSNLTISNLSHIGAPLCYFPTFAEGPGSQYQPFPRAMLSSALDSIGPLLAAPGTLLWQRNLVSFLLC